jgi:hypothetical protein
MLAAYFIVNNLRLATCLVFCAPLVGCINVNVPDTIKVEANVNVNVKVDKAVNDLFADIYGDSQTVQAPAPAPAGAP